MNSRYLTAALATAFAVTGAFAVAQYGNSDKKEKTWHVKADYIEACSCTMFCCCYFNTKPDGGMMCEFNNAIRIRNAHVGDIKLDGKKFWISGDLGGDFTKGMKSAVVTFDQGTTQAEKDAIMVLVGKLYPVTWQSVNMDVAPITWERKGDNGFAKLGDKAEIMLTPTKGADGKITVIHNLAYWGAQKNDGFELAYGKHRYKGFGHDYSHEGKNGFFITVESSGNIE